MDTQAAMQASLRVLTAVCERRHPDLKDIEELKCLMPMDANSPPDELACKVINAYAEARQKARARGTGD